MEKSITVEHLAFGNSLADTAREVLSEASLDNLSTSVKADRSLVTSLDIKIEKQLRQAIEDKFPHHGIIGEEYGSTGQGSSYSWVLDPIDGTAAFVAGIPVFGTLIALAVDGIPRLGIIDIPVLNLRWVGAEGQQTVCNNRPVRTRNCGKLDSALAMMGGRDRFSASQLEGLDSLCQATGTRVYGGICLSYGRLAEGRADIVLDAGQGIYDFAPYRPIIEGAGGIVTDWNGAPLTLASDGNILAAGNAAIHEFARTKLEIN